MNVFRQNNLSLKYQRFKPSGCYDNGIRKFEFVAKTQFLSRIRFEQMIWKIRIHKSKRTLTHSIY